MDPDCLTAVVHRTAVIGNAVIQATGVSFAVILGRPAPNTVIATFTDADADSTAVVN